MKEKLRLHFYAYWIRISFLFQVLQKFTILVNKGIFFFFGIKPTHFLMLCKYPNNKK